MRKWGHMNVCTFYFKHSQSNVLFLYFFVFVFLFFTFCLELYSSFYDTLTKRAISDWIVLEVKTQERRSLEKTNQRLTLTFQWKLNKQRCNYERMRDKDVKFIHIISIATVVYSNGINLKTLMSHWRHLTTTFKWQNHQRSAMDLPPPPPLLATAAKELLETHLHQFLPPFHLLDHLHCFLQMINAKGTILNFAIESF